MNDRQRAWLKRHKKYNEDILDGLRQKYEAMWETDNPMGMSACIVAYENQMELVHEIEWIIRNLNELEEGAEDTI